MVLHKTGFLVKKGSPWVLIQSSPVQFKSRMTREEGKLVLNAAMITITYVTYTHVLALPAPSGRSLPCAAVTLPTGAGRKYPVNPQVARARTLDKGPPVGVVGLSWS